MCCANTYVQSIEVTMSINFNEALDIHPQALVLREMRIEILAANLANADTPTLKCAIFILVRS